MIAPLILLVFSLVAVGFAVTLPGLSDLLLVAVPCALGALILLVWSRFRHEKSEPVWPKAGALPGPARPRRKAAEPRWIVVDGSNVMHWGDGPPGLGPLHEVLAYLAQRGFAAGVVFDANAGYLIGDRYLHHAAFGHLLGLPEDRVMVVPKGSPADATVLLAARDLRARIVTNDRYRDWAEQYPEVRTAGHLIRGGYREGALWLALDPPEAANISARAGAGP
jgi:hypothetical protein